jgi:hypothetical protein
MRKGNLLVLYLNKTINRRLNLFSTENQCKLKAADLMILAKEDNMAEAIEVLDLRFFIFIRSMTKLL